MSLQRTNIGFIGAGAMAESMVRGLLSAGIASTHISMSDVQAQRLESLQGEFEVHIFSENQAIWDRSDIVILAVKPQQIQAVLQKLDYSAAIDTPLVISIAAGITLAFLESLLPSSAPVIRSMPNTPSMVGKGATAIALGTAAHPRHEEQARFIFQAVGQVHTLPEVQLDAVTGLSGSGPAYVYIMVEALADAGVKAGLPRKIALELAAQTMAGAAQMVLETGLHPGELKDQVTSPGGTTIAGVHVLEQNGLRGILMDAVLAAANRSKELRG